MATDTAADGQALHSNFGVDYVLSYRFADTDVSRAEAQFERLVRTLANVGLATEARSGQNCSVLVFVRPASERHLSNAVYRSRVQDWLYGVRHAAPEQETRTSLASDPLTDAERLRVIYSMITNPPGEGGAGITPKRGEWKEVESVFPLHDHTFNKKWMKSWGSTYLVKLEDQDEIRNRFGEKIAFYFTFIQSYLIFLVFPAAFGFSAWVLLGSYSTIYAIASCLWSVVFVEYWKQQEIDLRIRWACGGVSAVQAKRIEFQHEREFRDPATGETVKTYPAHKRILRQLLQVPFAILASVVLGSLIAVCFGIEIFISEVYGGPFKSILVYLPTGLLTTLVPTLTTLLTGFATRLTDYENYETQDSYEAAMTQKIFVLNFITSYLPIFLTAFVYVPFGGIVVPYLDILGLTVQPFAENEKQMRVSGKGFEIDPSRLRKQVIYFTVTAQIVNFALEVIVPIVKRKAFHRIKEMKGGRAQKAGKLAPNPAEGDRPGEAAFLARVRNEAELDEYDVTTDLREMCVQFGYLSMFSVVWPLTSISFLINNWIEIRSDAVKICVEMQRPIPWRADSIGPWLDNLGFLSWLGSVTTAALVYMFRSDGAGPGGTPSTMTGWALLLTILASEHLYLLVRVGVRSALSQMESGAVQKERREQYIVRKRYLESASGLPLAPEAAPSGVDEQVTRRSLEEEARQESMHLPRPEDRFWARQKYWPETVRLGTEIIRESVAAAGKKRQ